MYVVDVCIYMYIYYYQAGNSVILDTVHHAVVLLDLCHGVIISDYHSMIREECYSMFDSFKNCNNKTVNIIIF